MNATWTIKPLISNYSSVDPKHVFYQKSVCVTVAVMLVVVLMVMSRMIMVMVAVMMAMMKSGGGAPDNGDGDDGGADDDGDVDDDDGDDHDAFSSYQCQHQHTASCFVCQALQGKQRHNLTARLHHAALCG